MNDVIEALICCDLVTREVNPCQVNTSLGIGLLVLGRAFIEKGKHCQSETVRELELLTLCVNFAANGRNWEWQRRRYCG